MPKKINESIKFAAVSLFNNNDIKKKKAKIASESLNVSKSSVYNWNHHHVPNKLGRKILYTPPILCYIMNYVLENVTFKMNLLIESIREKFNLNLHKSQIYKYLKKMNVSRKKIKKISTSVNKDELKHKIMEFKKKMDSISRNKIISVDEASFDTYLSADYGWSEKGTKIEKKFDYQKKRFTLISAISNEKMINNMLIEGSAKSHNFIEFIKQIIEMNNNLPPNEKLYILLDNAKIHHTKELTNLLKDTQIELIYNPPYSPQYNPIERVFSKVKYLVKEKDNRSLTILKENIGDAYNKITKENFNSFFQRSLETELKKEIIITTKYNVSKNKSVEVK